MNKYLLSLIFIIFLNPLRADYMLIPMDETQTNHLKAYGVAFWVLKSHQQVQWLLSVIRYTLDNFVLHPLHPSIAEQKKFSVNCLLQPQCLEVPTQHKSIPGCHTGQSVSGRDHHFYHSARHYSPDHRDDFYRRD